MVGGFRSEALFKSGLPSAVRLAAWQAFEREGKGSFGKASFRRERNARASLAFCVSCFSLSLPFQTPTTQATVRSSAVLSDRRHSRLF